MKGLILTVQIEQFSKHKNAAASIGYKAELEVRKDFEDAGYTPVVAVDNGQDGFKGFKGSTGIDGIYKDSNGNYVIVESKSFGHEKPAVDREVKLCGKGKLAKCSPKDKGKQRQMSEDWINDRIKKDDTLSKAEKQKILKDLEKGKVKRVYAETDDSGTKYYEVNTPKEKNPQYGKKKGASEYIKNKSEAEIGKPLGTSNDNPRKFP